MGGVYTEVYLIEINYFNIVYYWGRARRVIEVAGEVVVVVLFFKPISREGRG